MRRYAASLPTNAAGKWCRFTLSIEAAGPVWAKLELADSARAQVVREAFFPRANLPRPHRGRRHAGQLGSLLLHVPGAAGALTLTIFARGRRPMLPVLRVRVLTRTAASVLLLASGLGSLPVAFRGSPVGLSGRLRAVLGQRGARRGAAPPYDVWIDLFDRWTEAERLALAARLPGKIPAIDVAILPGESKAALAATLASVAAQWGRAAPTARVIAGSADWAALHGDWLVILEAGEVLAPHAIACFLLAARRNPHAAAFCADSDRLGRDGTRGTPRLSPPPDPWLLRSDFWAAGAWMFSRRAVAAALPHIPASAGTARLALARSLPSAMLQRVPLILCHMPVGDAPAADLPAPFLGSCGDTPLVSIIIPSACRSRHVLRCLRQLLYRTDYPAFEILLAVSSIDPSDRAQAACFRRAAALPHVRIIELDMPEFSFSAVNNRAAEQAKGDYLLLLNDDVVPRDTFWLRKMITYVCGDTGAAADVVGTRLLYGNGMVQHAGVIIGLANLCEHAFRLADGSDPGPHGLARLDRQVSAVTAACMLVRRSLFESLQGFDEGFAIALNDVDFCLRAAAAGARIVFSASVEMYHFESLSLGRHYAGPRAALEALEVSRFRRRWAGVIAADPFYHPCASLEPGREFQPGFPPRQTPLSWIGQEPLALH